MCRYNKTIYKVELLQNMEKNLIFMTEYDIIKMDFIKKERGVS